MSIHLVLLTLSSCALAAAAAGGQLAGLTNDTVRARQIALPVTGALVVGNAVCLLPETPAWYSVALIALTFAGLTWLAVSTVAARRDARRRTAVRAGTRYGTGGAAAGPASSPPSVVSVTSVRSAASTGPAASNASTRPPAPRVAIVSSIPADQVETTASARPHLAVLLGALTPERPAPTTYPVVEATLVTDTDTDTDADTEPTPVPVSPQVRPGVGIDWDAEMLAEYLAERSLVTRADLDTIGSRGARAQNVQIARLIGSYAPEAGRRRATGSAFRPRAHTADGRLLRERLRAAYEDAPPPRPTRDGQA